MQTTKYTQPQTIALVAGEASGDILGASLMKSLKARLPEVRFIGVGGPLMAAEGLDSIFPLDRLSVMGIVDVVKQLPDLLRARREVIDTMLAASPDIFVGIDAPDFTIPVEAKLKKAGIVTVHYVSPSVWAWRQKRVFKIAAATHNVLCLLPFEKQFYDRFDVPATFVGHTLADEIPLHSDAAESYTRLATSADKTYVGLLPGSRRTEVGLLAPEFIGAAIEVHKHRPDVEFLVPLVNAERREQFGQALAGFRLPADLHIHLIDGHSRDVMLCSSSLLLASGTVALEAMLLKRPMAVAYKFSTLNYHMLKYLVKLEHFSLPNLLAGEALVPELLQYDVTPAALAEHVLRHLEEPQEQLLQRFHQLHTKLQLNAADTAADAVLATFYKLHR